MATRFVLAACCAFAPASAFTLIGARLGLAKTQRSAPITCVATSAEDKALLAASKKVVMVAKRFGTAPGKGAQAWVEQAVKGGDARTESLMSMQLALFEECQLDDESGKCKDLTAAMEALVTAVDSRSSSSFFQEGVLKPSSLTLQFGATPLQTAATKLRNAASKFGPEQKAAADKWIKAVTNKGSPSALLEEQIALFGECALSEDGTPSNCQLLDQALEDFQEALETCNIETTCTGESAVAARPETDMEYRKRMSRRIA